MRYRLALSMGCTSLGWALVRLDAENQPTAIIKTGVRTFADGRNPKDGSSLAVTRREARALRRRRDRMLKRKARMTDALLAHGFFPADEAERRVLVKLDPYALRAKGLDEALSGAEFARALFHINQRRGFKSNRKTDRQGNDSGALKTAISKLRMDMQEENCRSVGEWLYKRHRSGGTVRARYRQNRITREDGSSHFDKHYDLYIDRGMIADEFDALWAAQARFNPTLFSAEACADLRYTLLFQRPLKPVEPGRCALLPDEERAPLALPSAQRFRMYQEVNELRILRIGGTEEALSLAQRDLLIQALERNTKRSFLQIRRLLGLGVADQFNFEDPKRQELKGDSTSAMLSRTHLFGEAWFGFDAARQDAIVEKLVTEENEAKLIRWLVHEVGVTEDLATALAGLSLAEGSSSLCLAALDRVLPELRRDIVSYDAAVRAAGFTQESCAPSTSDGNPLAELPYYGRVLRRQIGFGSGKPGDSDERRYGKVTNPTVHIGLNQLRLVVNALIQRYGHPAQVSIELSRDLIRNRSQREEDGRRQADNQRRHALLRADIAAVQKISPDRVRNADIQKVMLWEELAPDPHDRRCPYSGAYIHVGMLLSPQVEITHILPFSVTLDDSLSNKTLVMRDANRVKGDRTPWQARDLLATKGWDYSGVLKRVHHLPKPKRFRFSESGYQRWLKNDADFVTRALNDSHYLGRMMREYLSLICPQQVQAIPGRLTPILRAKLGLNDVLGLSGPQNCNDHRHHAVDACVVGITDRDFLLRFAQASAEARLRHAERLVDQMPQPWDSYHAQVKHAVNHIWVSHKPDHSHEGAMHNDTAYGLLDNGRVSVHKVVNGKRQYVEDKLRVIEFSNAKTADRHGLLPNGDPKPYKGYKGDSNYCMEIVRSDKGKWEGEVVSTFQAYQLVRSHGAARLRHPRLSVSGKPLVMRLVIGDTVRMELPDGTRTMRLAKMSGNGQVFMAATSEAHVDARNRDQEDPFLYTSKMAGSLYSGRARRVTISPIGELRDPGFKS